jgi:iron(III) transport system ATP-binding protein
VKTSIARSDTEFESTAVSAAGSPREVVRLSGLSKSYQDPRYPAVAGLDLTVHEGEIFCLLGPSGCGKTTLLRLIAGFEVPDSGSVHIGGREVVGAGTWVQPERRAIGFVFQDFALFPHLNVLQNVAFGVVAGSRRDRFERAREILDLVGLTIFSRRYPHQLSGGQQQRVALARALAPRPDVILLDEPFSNLDAALRQATRDEVRNILEDAGTTALLVTHDQEEALTFADRLAVMRAGRIEQSGLPEEVYKRPRTAFVAKFLGKTNLLHGVGHGTVAETPFGRLPLARPAEGRVLLSLRPEDLAFDTEQGVAVSVLSRNFKGHDLTFTCETIVEPDEASELLTVQTGPECGIQAGDVVRLTSRGPAVPLEGSVAPGGD